MSVSAASQAIHHDRASCAWTCATYLARPASAAIAEEICAPLARQRLERLGRGIDQPSVAPPRGEVDRRWAHDHLLAWASLNLPDVHMLVVELGGQARRPCDVVVQAGPPRLDPTGGGLAERLNHVGPGLKDVSVENGDARPLVGD